MRLFNLILVLGLLTVSIQAKQEFEQERVLHNIGNTLSHRDDIKLINRVVENRLENLLSVLMRETNLAM